MKHGKAQDDMQPEHNFSKSDSQAFVEKITQRKGVAISDRDLLRRVQ
jgi:hypothetical protein